MKYISIIFLIFILVACQQDISVSKFSLLPSETTGIDFNNQLVESDSFNIIQYLYFYNGAGVGAGDINGDGQSDLIFNANQSHPRIYINESSDGIKFKDITKQIGLDTITGWGTGVAMADINGDGLLDIYLSQAGNYKNFKGRNRLLVNQGSEGGIPSFKDETESYGLTFSGLSTQAAFLDFDGDGDLDMYLLNHSTHQTSNYAPTSIRTEIDKINGDRLYRNDNNFFVDVTEASGIYASRIGYGLGIAISDMDNNGFPDIYIANDFHENDYLYWNDNGKFEEGIYTATGHNSQFSMGVDIADVNGDGNTDIYSLDMMPEDPKIRNTSVGFDAYNILKFKQSYGYHDQFPYNHLQINNGASKVQFFEQAAMANVESTDWSWSCLLEDYDQDGDTDIFVSNGILKRPNDLDYLNYFGHVSVQKDTSDLDLIAHMPDGLVNNYFFYNKGDVVFEKDNSINFPSSSNGATYVDLDNDGDLDIVTNNINENAFVYENHANENISSNYLRIRLKGEGANKFGIGSKIELKVGNQLITKEVFLQRGFMSSVDPILCIGLGETSMVDSLLVTWSRGAKQWLVNVDANQEIVIYEKNSKDIPLKHNYTSTYFEKEDSFLEYKHIENNFNEIEREHLSPQLFSREGPCIASSDIDGDGTEEIFIGGGKSQAPAMFKKEGSTYSSMQDSFWISEAFYEDTDATFFDADQDGDMDLYVLSGGNEYVMSSPALLDRLYINNGSGQFEKRTTLKASSMLENSACIAVADIDGDGDKDLFVGARVSSKNHTFTPISYILYNNGKGDFSKSSASDLGLVTDAEWGDLDQDGDDDLVVVGDWMPITILINKEGKFVKEEIKNTNGWWRSVKLSDINGDGKLDIIGGNFGTNSDIEPSQETPLRLVLRGFERSYMTYDDGIAVASADDLVKQIPELRKEFRSYDEYANLNMDKMFIDDIYETKEVYSFESKIFYNKGNSKFEQQNLPLQAQVSPINSILVEDINQDGLQDLIVAGNEINLNTRLGKKDASEGIVMIQNKNNSFDVIPSKISGLHLQGMIRNSLVLKDKDGIHYFFASNNDSLQVYTLRRD